jgi:hypothetical protein
MSKFIKLFTACFLAAAVLAVSPQTPLHATHGFSSHALPFTVNGVRHELWGYSGELVPHYRLRDIAYALNGTIHQFDIRESADGTRELILGAPYTVQGTEMRPIAEPRHATFGSYGLISSHGFPEENISFQIEYTVYHRNGSTEHHAFRAVNDIDEVFVDFFEVIMFLGIVAQNSDIWEFYVPETDGFQLSLPLPNPATGDVAQTLLPPVLLVTLVSAIYLRRKLKSIKT